MAFCFYGNTHKISNLVIEEDAEQVILLMITCSAFFTFIFYRKEYCKEFCESFDKLKEDLLTVTRILNLCRNNLFKRKMSHHDYENQSRLKQK